MRTATGISIEVYGKSVPIEDATWFLIAPCGCGAGCSSLDYGTELHLTPESAWASFNETAALRKKYARLGYTVELGLRSEVKERVSIKCQHVPTWGHPPTPQREGFTWASAHGTSTLHLVADAKVRTETSRDERALWADTEALCGKTSYGWSSEWHRVDSKVECAKCEKAATS